MIPCCLTEFFSIITTKLAKLFSTTTRLSLKTVNFSPQQSNLHFSAAVLKNKMANDPKELNGPDGKPISKNELKRLQKAQKKAEEKAKKDAEKLAKAQEKAKESGSSEPVKLLDETVMSGEQYREYRMNQTLAIKDPYPHKFHVTTSVPNYIEKYNSMEAGEHRENDVHSLAGRVYNIRASGKSLRVDN